jgi:hypothetical protein
VSVIHHVILKLVSAQTAITLLAINQRVAERLFMARILPDQAIEDDAGINALHVVALVNHPAPPRVLDVVRQFDAERAVIPSAA